MKNKILKSVAESSLPCHLFSRKERILVSIGWANSGPLSYNKLNDFQKLHSSYLPYRASCSLSCFLGWYCSKNPSISNRKGNTIVIIDITTAISFFLQNVLLASDFVERSTTITTAKTEKASKPRMTIFTKILKLMTFQLKWKENAFLLTFMCVVVVYYLF